MYRKVNQALLLVSVDDDVECWSCKIKEVDVEGKQTEDLSCAKKELT